MNDIVKNSRKILRNKHLELLTEKVRIYNELRDYLVSVNEISEISNRKFIVRQLKSGDYGVCAEHSPNNIISEVELDTYIFNSQKHIENYENSLKEQKKISKITDKIMTVLSEEEFQYFMNYYNKEYGYV